jgi:hypothetical protein
MVAVCGVLAMVVLAAASASAEVVRVEISEREVVADDGPTPRPGPYEVIKGVLHFEVDPDNLANRRIVDLKLAERNSRGRVVFSAEFELHKPVNADRGNRRLLYFVNNRGNRFGNYHFNHQAGNWLYDQGWSYLWCGWNVDVVESERRLNITVPVVTDGGKTITGKVYNEILSYADGVVHSRPLVWGGSIAYPAADLETSSASLTMRRYPWDEPVAISSDGFAFARFEDGEVIPDPRWLYVKEGFKPGWLYELVYIAKDPKVAGLGLAAIRDAVSFFRYEDDERNPLADVVDHAYAWGHSQSGRLLNHFVYQGFNGDEEGRMALDGVIANCPGSGKGLFNSRFAQITRHGSHLEDTLYPIDVFPFTTVQQVDSVTGERGDGLAGSRRTGSLPKIFYINTTTDYWTRAASLLHTDVTGSEDAEIDPSARIYFIAGRTHIESRTGIIGRALLVAMDRWVSRDEQPPSSVVPKIADGTLVTLDDYLEVFPRVPGARTPPSFYRPYRLDLGPRWHAEGIADFAPPKVGPQYGALVPQVGPDGNELAGIKLPEIAAPLATFTGWMMRSPEYSDTLRRNRGSVFPLPRTTAERTATGDGRTSIEERYPTEADYMLGVAAGLIDLRRRGFLLDRDLAMLLDEAARQAPLITELRLVDRMAEEEGAAAAFAYYETLRAAGVTSVFGVDLERLPYLCNAGGYRLMEAGRLEQALEVFRLATLIVPQSANAWDSLGECEMRMGRFDDALAHYRKSLELDPSNHNATRMIERIQREAARSPETT